MPIIHIGVVKSMFFLSNLPYLILRFVLFAEGGGSDSESSRYHKETKFLGKRFASKTINFTDEFQPNLNVKLVPIQFLKKYVTYSFIK